MILIEYLNCIFACIYPCCQLYFVPHITCRILVCFGKSYQLNRPINIYKQATSHRCSFVMRDNKNAVKMNQETERSTLAHYLPENPAKGEKGSTFYSEILWKDSCRAGYTWSPVSRFPRCLATVRVPGVYLCGKKFLETDQVLGARKLYERELIIDLARDDQASFLPE